MDDCGAGYLQEPHFTTRHKSKWISSDKVSQTENWSSQTNKWYPGKTTPYLMNACHISINGLMLHHFHCRISTNRLYEYESTDPEDYDTASFELVIAKNLTNHLSNLYERSPLQKYSKPQTAQTSLSFHLLFGQSYLNDIDEPFSYPWIPFHILLPKIPFEGAVCHLRLRNTEPYHQVPKITPQSWLSRKLSRNRVPLSLRYRNDITLNTKLTYELRNEEAIPDKDHVPNFASRSPDQLVLCKSQRRYTRPPLLYSG